MTDTRVTFDGLDNAAIATLNEATAGVATDKLMTADKTKAAITSNLNAFSATGLAKAFYKVVPFRLGATATRDITVNTGEVVFSDNSRIVIGTEFTKRINATFVAGTDVGGLDAGSVANNTLYYIYIISNAANTLVDAIFSLSATAPTMPSGYTKRVRVGSVLTNASAQISLYKATLQEYSNNGTVQAFFLLEGTSAGVSNITIQHGANWASDTNRFLFDSAGNFTASANVTAYSDKTLKENIQPIENALELVRKLEGVHFTRKRTQSNEIGVIAQDVEKILPEVVLTHDDGLKSVAYGNIVAVLIEAIKELDKKINDTTK